MIFPNPLLNSYKDCIEIIIENDVDKIMLTFQNFFSLRSTVAPLRHPWEILKGSSCQNKFLFRDILCRGLWLLENMGYIQNIYLSIGTHLLAVKRKLIYWDISCKSKGLCLLDKKGHMFYCQNISISCSGHIPKAPRIFICQLGKIQSKINARGKGTAWPNSLLRREPFRTMATQFIPLWGNILLTLAKTNI